ncbi:MAG TPA: bacillithiol system redox-active protein YtxJ [archaeon]|nr:bacillithiol system redox-active protein YtxJ [archaeon]
MYKTVKDIDRLLEESNGKRVLILKHSLTCPISSAAKREIDSFLENNHQTEVYLVVVQEQRAVSNELAERLSVKHESPQLLVLKDCRAEKVLNHFQIRREEVEKLL